MVGKKKILIVEDCQEIQEMFELALQSSGYDVDIAGNGIKLIKKIRDTKPDLILMDILMPWVDGYDLCRDIKGLDDICNIPIIIVTCKTAPEDIQKGFDAGATEYLEKPVEIDKLLQTVASVLAQN